MSFSERFDSYRSFDNWVQRCVRKFYYHLRDNQVELSDPRYPTRAPSAFRPRWRFEGYEFGEDGLVLHGCEYHMGDYIGGKGVVPMCDFLEFAEHQWELDNFDQKLGEDTDG